MTLQPSFTASGGPFVAVQVCKHAEIGERYTAMRPTVGLARNFRVRVLLMVLEL